MYPLEEIHDFTYNWAEWRIMKDIEFEAKGGKYMTMEELVDFINQKN